MDETLLIPPGEVVTIGQLEAEFRQRPCYKGLGPGGLGGEAMHFAPVPLARVFHPVFVKAHMVAMEPWCWK
eukprot:3743048-Lingulodinium_polyedra.AAC.1